MPLTPSEPESQSQPGSPRRPDRPRSVSARRDVASGWDITTDIIAWGAEFWVPDAARRADPAVSPLFEPDLGGLPAAAIVTAEHDPLRDEGEAYAARLEAAGTPVLLRREPADSRLPQPRHPIPRRRGGGGADLRRHDPPDQVPAVTVDAVRVAARA
jgi:hypothetical protein